MPHVTPHITYVYDDATENLLDQYTQQLAVYEKVFETNNKHLDNYEFSRLRDRDEVMMAILDVIARIYDQAIPIAILLNDGVKLVPDKGPNH